MAASQDLSLTLQAKLFRGLADPSRLAILDALGERERTVSELVELTGLSQPSVSGHLACLRECGLVTNRQEGRYVHYALADARIEGILRAARDIPAGVAARVRLHPLRALRRLRGP